MYWKCCEIYRALTVVEKHYSFKSSDTSTLFIKRFPDIASKFACGVKECSYLTSFFSKPLLCLVFECKVFKTIISVFNSLSINIAICVMSLIAS